MAKPTTSESLNPDTLKFYRKKAGLSRHDLAEHSKRPTISETTKNTDDKYTISETTIYRWEHGKQTKNVRSGSRKALERALGVRWEVLTRPVKEDETSSISDRVPLKAGIAGPARTVLTFMQLHYGLREQDIIDLAPLAFVILAEHSLQARKAALDETKQALEDATADAYRRLPYLRGAFHDGYDYEWTEAEKKSLEEREVYEQYVDHEGEEMSPFVDFLEKELKALGLFQKHPIEFSSSYRGAPGYAIPIETLAESLELDANDEADRRILELIQDGDIDFWQAWEKKREATEDGYRSWLAEQHGAIEEAIEEERRRIANFHIAIKIHRKIPPDTKSDGDNANKEEQS